MVDVQLMSVGDAQDAAAVSVAPCVVLRVAGLPLRITDGSDFDRLEDLLDSRELAQQHLRQSETNLAEALFDAVSRAKVNDGPTRQIIQLRRDAHNGRSSADMGEKLEPVLSEAEKTLLGVVREAVRYNARLDGELDREFAFALDRRTQKLLDVVDYEADFGDGLALATPALSVFLADVDFRSDGRKLVKTARALASYVGRASRKTSPFSTFTTVGTRTFGSDQAGGDREGDPATSRSLTISRTLVQTLVQAASRFPELANLIEIAPPSSRIGSPHPEAQSGLLVAKPVVYDGFFFAEDEILDVTVDDRAFAAIDERGTMASVAADLAVDHRTIMRLANAGVLRLVAPVGAFENFCSAVLEELGPEDEFAAAVAQVGAQLRRVRDGRGSARAEALIALRRESARAISAAGGVVPGWLNTAHLAHETRSTPMTLLPAVDEADVRATIDVIARQLTPSVHVSNVYSALVDAFVESVGPTRRVSLLELVAGALRSEGFGRAHTRAATADFAQMTRPHPLTDAGGTHHGFGTVSPPTFTAFLQFSGGGETDYRCVVNRVNQGAGGLLLRWAKVEDLRPSLVDAFTPWLEQLHPGSRLAMCTTGDGWSDVQELPAGVMDVLSWPTQAPDQYDPDHLLRPEDVVVSYHSDTHTLQLRERSTDRPVVLPYMGIVPPHLLHGASRILQCLSDPWKFDYRLGLDRTAAWWWPSGSGVERVPRVQQSGVVLRRAAWLVPSGEFPISGSLSANEGAAALASLKAWRQLHDIPRRVFARPGRDRLATTPPKPQFVDLLDPLTLDVLAGMVRKHEWVTLEEALPDAAEAWWPTTDIEPRAAEVSVAFALGRSEELR